ncbi:MAG: RluA family pseudouridine synthase [Rectinemataceae bacterium]|nr:RluA family pseudouridine synthase [Rectinemataceae bacterium]
MIGILFENEEIVIVDKPAGLPSQPGEGVGSTVLSIVEAELGFKPFPIHRLDKETAGCMILARNAAAAASWSHLLAGRGVRKFYRAVCAGGPLTDRGSYSDDLIKGGKASSALTHFICLARFGKNGGISPAFSFLELELGSGRTHQIRRHTAMHGHPILGDDKYGNFPLNRQLKKDSGLRHLLLWSYRLDIPGFPPIRASRPRHFTDFLGYWSDFPGMAGMEAL